MLFLVMNIAHNCGKIPLAEWQNTIFILPVKLKFWLDQMIDKMWTVPFYITNKFCALVIISNHLCFLFFGLARSQLQNNPFTAVFVPILLLTLRIVTVFYDVDTIIWAAFVGDCFLYHMLYLSHHFDFYHYPLFYFRLDISVTLLFLFGVWIFDGSIKKRFASAIWATWLLYVVLIDLTDVVAEALNKPFAAISAWLTQSVGCWHES